MTHNLSDADRKKMEDHLYPETVEQALARWDANESIFTVEMGGLGPGYEQCIHIVCFELIRHFKDAPRELFDDSEANREKIGDLMNEYLWSNPITAKLGLSGAQAGAGKSLAYRAIRDGWRKMIYSAKEQDPERMIQVQKAWPSAL